MSSETGEDSIAAPPNAQVERDSTNQPAENKVPNQVESNENQSSYNKPDEKVEHSNNVIESENSPENGNSSYVNNVNNANNNEDNNLNVNSQIVSKMAPQEDAEPRSNDVENFDGKIVYNPDGSAYIIATSDIEDEALLPKQEGSIVEQGQKEPKELTETGEDGEASKSSPAYPQIANALFITRSAAYYNALYGQAYTQMLQEKMAVPPADTPICHTYRVISLEDECKDARGTTPPLPDFATAAVPVKPVLMCFICKLSFGFAKSLGTHFSEEHQVELSEEEKKVMEGENTSAIIQMVGGKESQQRPIISFLEPISKPKAQQEQKQISEEVDLTKESESVPSPRSEQATPRAESPAPGMGSEPKALSPSAIKGLLSAALTSQVAAAVSAAAAASRNGGNENERTQFPPLPPLQMSMENLPLPLHLRNPFGPPGPDMGGNNGNLSPLVSTSPAIPSNANMLQGTTIGACPDHVNGRQAGVECSKCDIILNRMPGSMGWNAARNSCKTLKCPKCNWHYKYQETLEIHMKEKHPESETTCIYCITGQQHPRLARGETYTCGYKPYRCEVCNYSTTTKGNLSIHMQSDKHLNNMQELQNGGAMVSPQDSQRLGSPMNRGIPNNHLAANLAKQKPNWRCEVCNYETNVARNLRIHMTSEKHTHNIMVLQQNVQNMQKLTGQGGGGPMPGMPPFPLLPPGMDPQAMLQMQLNNMSPPGDLSNSPQQPEAAMADMAYLQAVMMQMMTGGQIPGPFPNNLGSPHSDFPPLPSPMELGLPGPGQGPESLEQPPEAADPNPKFLFNCCVCKDFGSDSLDVLSQHLTHDRTKGREHEVSIVIAGNFICKLCNYKTNLKANFQLHCKTDKHLQRLNHVNHIKEGGPANEWKLKFLNVTNPVQLRCNACDYYTNSLHKLQLHIANQRHEISTILFAHLRKSEGDIPEDRRSYRCSLCKFTSPGKLLLMAHVRSMKHLQMEQIHQLQKRSEGNSDQTEIGEIFQVVEDKDRKEAKDGESSNDRDSTSTPSGENNNQTQDGASKRCPLCQEQFSDYQVLENHVNQVHSVNSEGLQRLLMLMEGSHWLNRNQAKDSASATASGDEDGKEGLSGGVLDPATNALLRKSNDNGKMDDNNAEVKEVEKEEEQELPKALFGMSPRKMDKGLNYPLEKYLDPNRPYKCEVCKESFTQKNILLVHYNSVSHLHKLKRSMQEQQNQQLAMQKENSSLGNRSPGSGGGSSLENAINNLRKDHDEESKPYKCNICKVAYTQGSTLDIHIRSVLHQTRASKLQELALTGQIDLSKPLIEQPDPKPFPEQKKLITEMLSPKSLNSSGSSNPQSSPTQNSAMPGSPGNLTPMSSPMTGILGGLQHGNLVPKSLNDLFANSDQLQPQQQLAKVLQALGSGNGPDGPAAAAAALEEKLLKNSPDGSKSSPVLKNLLQNYGFELVMQFNEFKQKQKEEEARKLQEEKSRKEAAEVLEAEKKEREESAMNGVEESKANNEDNPNKAENSKKTPEIRKSKCPVCTKEFSSIWVLKAHSEEIHKDVVSQEFIEKYVDELKAKMDKDDEDAERNSTTEKDDGPRTPEKSELQPRRETSTPRSDKATPALEAESPGPSRPSSTSHAQDSSPNRGQENLMSNLNDMQNAFQQAILAAQQQSQNINPLMLQMSQLQGMNPLVAMNLQPPLIPPALFQPPGSNNNIGSPVGGNSPDPMMKLLNQMQGSQKHQSSPPGAMDKSMQFLAKLGLDPNLLAQGGFDPNILKSLGQAPQSGNQPPFPPGALDPKLLALMRNQGAGPLPSPDGMPPLGLLPQSPDPKLFLQLAQMGVDPKLFSQQGKPLDPKLLQMPGNPMDPKHPFLGLPPNFDPTNVPGDSKGMLGSPKGLFPQPEQAKRARTRITDDQLKVLRSYFDINNSPTEEAITTMAGKTGLPPKVIKHWFRNTLFKERQRNKDSPYNFNNPPSTMLNLEEYEKTGESKVTPIKSAEDQGPKEMQDKPSEELEPKEEQSPTSKANKEMGDLRLRDETLLKAPTDQLGLMGRRTDTPSTSSGSPNPLPLDAPPVSSMSLQSILASQMGHKPPGNFLPNPFLPNLPGVPTSMAGVPGSMPSFLNPLAMMGGPDSPGARSPPLPPGSLSQGKRANRTRFTDYQIKVLQEFFENNAYPKDDDLEYLSKLLSLSPRVIVVWFQNARQKARKIYENQPPLDPTEDGSGRFTRTPGLNYQCKKCLLVFQRYYELIRHQKQHCFKEEDAKRSAQAQKAAAQAAAQFNTQAPGSNMNPMTPHSEDSNSSFNERSMPSPMFNNSGNVDGRRSLDGSDDSPHESPYAVAKREEERKMTPSMFDQLTSPPFSGMENSKGPGSNLFPSYPPTTPFGLLQQQALQSISANKDDSDDFDNESVASSPSSKRKLSDDGDTEEKDEQGQPRDKRLRTTILPEQLDFLYQKYQLESNPSRKMLEQIANEVGLRKRVVQVWFQNTRARERKGQFRAHQQVINKRCPFCPALFKVRSALESHLATKHADQYTRGEINIDTLPDAEGFDVNDLERPTLTPNQSTTQPPPNMPPFVSNPGSDLGESMRKYYEDTMKRYINDLQATSQAGSPSPIPRREGQALDLTSASPGPQPDQQPQPALDLSNMRENDNNSSHLEKSLDGVSDSISESVDNRIMVDFEGDDSQQQNDSHSSTGHNDGKSADGSLSGNKRFRTQMSNIQVKVMKSIFVSYKTPTMAECSALGAGVGLQKRVVQVWFQNARAKEKKAKLSLQQATGHEPESPPPPENCEFCQYTFPHKYVIQEHLFSKSHLDNVCAALEEGRYEPESPGDKLNNALMALQASVNQPPPSSSAPPTSAPHTSAGLPPLPPLPMLPNSPPVQLSDSGSDKEPGQEKSLMQQLYGMNHGINSFPSSVAQPNPFLHPAMFSAGSAGK